MKYLFNFWRCWGKQHQWRKEGESLGGYYRRCEHCGLLDEVV